MKHINYFNDINEKKNKFLKVLSLGMNKKFSPEDDVFLREVYCYCKPNSGVPHTLTNKNKYKLYAEFETTAMFSGKCFVILNNEHEFVGYDSGYFLEEYDWQMLNNPELAKASKQFNV